MNLSISSSPDHFQRINSNAVKFLFFFFLQKVKLSLPLVGISDLGPFFFSFLLNSAKLDLVQASTVSCFNPSWELSTHSGLQTRPGPLWDGGENEKSKKIQNWAEFESISPLGMKEDGGCLAMTCCSEPLVNQNLTHFSPLSLNCGFGSGNRSAKISMDFLIHGEQSRVAVKLTDVQKG